MKLMSTIISEIYSILLCPDDHSDLEIKNDGLICTNCKRKFLINENVIDLRPKERLEVKTSEVGEIYKTYYKNLTTYGNGGDKIGTFGIISNSISNGFVKETLTHLQKHVSKEMLVCDVGAGSGDYSVELAKKCKIMLHCDLDLNGIRIAQQNAKKQKIENIVFLYCDYFRLPIKNKIIDIICSIDILERGIEHERKLLLQMERITKQKCKILIDFHSKERKSLTHVENKALHTYSKNEIKNLIGQFEIKVMDIIGTGYVPQLIKWSDRQYSVLNPISRILSFPPARWFVLVLKK